MLVEIPSLLHPISKNIIQMRITPSREVDLLGQIVNLINKIRSARVYFVNEGRFGQDRVRVRVYLTGLLANFYFFVAF